MNGQTEISFLEALASETQEQKLGELARGSNLIFVRSIDQLAEDSSDAKGRRLTAFEALTAYGKDVLLETISEGSMLLCDSATAAGRVLKSRREQLGLSIRQVSNRSGVETRVIEEAEKSKRLPIREYERIARVLGLDERYLSVRSEPVGNEPVAVRLRTIGDEHPRMTGTAVAAIAEASWVAMTQMRLEHMLQIAPADYGIKPSPNYGSSGYPAFLHGYFLAQDTRKRLSIESEQVPSLRILCEETLGIPLVQAELGEFIAGVTVQIDGRRAIVINLSGKNRHVYVRRSTIAHELGHLLFDDKQQLNELMVDDYGQLEKPPHDIFDRVEQRANAFSVEFIAPAKEVVSEYEKGGDDPLGRIMDKFGVSYTAARYQLWNGLERRRPLEELTSPPRAPNPEFEAREAYTADFHPLQNIPVSRKGRFSAIVLRAAQELIISWDSAAEYLGCSERELRSKEVATTIRDLFPSVFPHEQARG